MPSSMCWPLRRSRQRSSRSPSSANQSVRSTGCQTPTLLIHPPRLVLEADVGAHRDDPRGDLGRRPASGRAAAGRAPPASSCDRRGGGRGRRARRPGPAPPAPRRGAGGRRPARTRGLPRPGGRSGPRVAPGRRRSSAASCAICASVSSAEWLAGCPSIGRPPALDRVGEDHRRPGRRGAGDGVEDSVGGRGRRGPRSPPRSCSVGRRRDQRSERRVERVAARAPGPPLLRRGAQQRLVLLVAHRRRGAAAGRRRPGGRTAR